MPKTEDVRKFYHPEGGIYRNEDEVVAHVKIENPSRVPHILGLAGPNRCGSTALLLLLTGNLPLINRGYYQPLKTIIRNSGPDFNLYEKDQLVCVKEVFGPRANQEYYNPINILIKAGVPPENMTWIMMLRDPVASFASWYAFTGDDSNPELYARAQRHTIDLYNYYQKMGLNVVPFVYELLANREGEVEVLVKLLQKAGFDISSLSLDFNLESLGITETGDLDLLNPNSKMVWGEAKKPDHWDAVIRSTVQKGRYQYGDSPEKVRSLPPNLKYEVERLCLDDYNRYLELSKNTLGL